MQIRKCPDCNGTGKHWVPPNQRESSVFVPQPHVSSTAGGFVITVRPEYEKCVLCGGIGKVVCRVVVDDEPEGK